MQAIVSHSPTDVSAGGSLVTKDVCATAVPGRFESGRIHRALIVRESVGIDSFLGGGDAEGLFG